MSLDADAKKVLLRKIPHGLFICGVRDGDEVNGEYDNSLSAQKKALQAEWKELSEEEKKPWKELATHLNSASGSE